MFSEIEALSKKHMKSTNMVCFDNHKVDPNLFNDANNQIKNCLENDSENLSVMRKTINDDITYIDKGLNQVLSNFENCFRSIQQMPQDTASKSYFQKVSI